MKENLHLKHEKVLWSFIYFSRSKYVYVNHLINCSHNFIDFLRIKLPFGKTKEDMLDTNRSYGDL